MNRVYDRAGYLDKVRRLQEQIPDVVITSDVIVRLPGETTGEFEETLEPHRGRSALTPSSPLSTPRVGYPRSQHARPHVPGGLRNFQRLVDRQDQISEEEARGLYRQDCPLPGGWEGTEGASPPAPRAASWSALTGEESLIGSFVDVAITGANKWSPIRRSGGMSTQKGPTWLEGWDYSKGMGRIS